MATLARLNVVLGLDSKEFAAGLDGAARKLTSFGKALTAGLTLPIAVAGFKAVQWASDTEESINAVSRTYGTAADAVIAWSETTADAFGIAQSDALQTMAVLSSVGRAAGFTDAEMATFGQGLIERSADLASFYNAAGGTNEVLVAMQAAFRGEFDPLDRFGVRITAAAVEQKALEMGLIGTNGVLTEQAKILAINALVMEQTEAVAGDFAETSDGLANLTRRLRARIKDLGAAFGKELLPIALKGLDVFEGLLSFFEKMDPSMRRWVIVIAAVAAALGPLLLVLGAFAGAIGNVVALSGTLGIAWGALLGPLVLLIAAGAALFLAWRTNFLGIGDLIGGIVGRISDAVSMIRDHFGSAEESLGTVGAAFWALGAAIDTIFGTNVVQAFIDFGQRVQAFVDETVAFFDELRARGFSPVEAAFLAFGNALDRMLGTDLSGFFGDLGFGLHVAWIGAHLLASVVEEDVLPALRLLGSLTLDGLTTTLGTLVFLLRGTLPPTIRVLAAGWMLAWMMMKDAVGLAFTAIAVSVPVAVATLEGMIQFVIDVGSRIINGFNGVVLFFRLLPAIVLAALGDLGTALYQKGAELIGGFRDGMEAIWSKAYDWLTARAGQAVAAVGDVAATLLAQGKDLITGLWNGAVDLWGDMETWLVSIPTKAVEAVGDLIGTLSIAGADLIIGLWNAAEDSWANDLRPWLTTIPSMIQGAVGSLGGLLFAAGQSVVQGLIDGIASMIGALQSIAQTLGGIIQDNKGPLPYDRVMLTPHGRAIVGGLIRGIEGEIPALRRTMAGVTGEVAGLAGVGGVGRFGLGAAGGGAAGGGFGLTNYGAVYIEANDPRGLGDALMRERYAEARA